MFIVVHSTDILSHHGCVFHVYSNQIISNKVSHSFLLLWHGLSDLGVGDLLVDSGRLHLLQRTHDTILLKPMSLNQGVHSVGVEHDVVGCDQQHPTHRALNIHGEKRETRQGDPTETGLALYTHQLRKQNQKHVCYIVNWRPNPFETTNVPNQVQAIDCQR